MMIKKRPAAMIFMILMMVMAVFAGCIPAQAEENENAGLTYEVDPDLATPCMEDGEKMFTGIKENMPRRVSNVKVGGEYCIGKAVRSDSRCSESRYSAVLRGSIYHIGSGRSSNDRGGV